MELRLAIIDINGSINKLSWTFPTQSQAKKHKYKPFQKRKQTKAKNHNQEINKNNHFIVILLNIHKGETTKDTQSTKQEHSRWEKTNNE